MSRRALSIILLLLICYSYVLPRWADWSQTSRLALVRAIVEQGTVRIDSYVATTGDYALIDGHSYSDKAPGPALLAVPVYAVIHPILQFGPIQRSLDQIAGSAAFASTVRSDGAGLGSDRVALAISHWLLTIIVIALPTALAMAGLDWLLRRWFQPGPALIGALGVGLATPLAPYAGNFYSHALVAALLIGAWALIERAADRSDPLVPQPDRSDPLRRSDPSIGWLLGSGFLLGYAAISEYPSVVIGAVLGLYAIYRIGWRAALWLILGGLPPLLLLAGYDLIAFGTIWPIGYAHSALWQDQHQTGFLSLTYPRPAALWGLLFSGFRGVFIRSPWLVLALPAIVWWWRSGTHRAVLIVAAVSAIGLLLVYGSSRMWWGGFAAGPRYIVPIIPFVAVPAVWLIDQFWSRRMWRVIVVALIALSIVLVWSEALAGQQFPPDTIADPWTGWTLPAWQADQIARNLGMAIGLSGAWSLVPLVLIGFGFWLAFRIRSDQTPRMKYQVLSIE